MSPDDFVALALAEPIESGAAKYGYAMRVASGNNKPPGVIALTWIAGKNDEERERIRAHAKQNVRDSNARKLAEPVASVIAENMIRDSAAPSGLANA